MNSKYIIALVVIVLIVGGSIYFFNNKNSSPTDSTTDSTQEKIPVSTTTNKNTAPVPVINTVVHNVSIVNFGFSPANITVRKGETIVWTNKDTMQHTVTGGDLKSNPLGENQTYSFAYDKTGVFPYHCSLHPSMKGTVTVTD